MTARPDSLQGALRQALGAVRHASSKTRAPFAVTESGWVQRVGRDVLEVRGLEGLGAEEVLRLPGGKLAQVMDLSAAGAGVVLLDSGAVSAADSVRKTGRVLETPVGEGLLGRVLDSLGRPLDGRGSVRASGRLPVERPAPPIMHRAPVTEPLQTGVKVVDGLIPIGRGQRELIMGDRQTGKTALALDAIVNQADKDVLCIYCAIGKRGSELAKVLEDLRSRGCLKYTVVIAATEDDSAGLQVAAPFSACSIGEHFMEQGRDVLLVMDDLTRHARAYRQLSLLLRRPPGREAFPGDIFYLHSRLLERGARLRPEYGGGSLTVLPVIETEAQNMSAYIPTNCISITDGQIYLSPQLFQKGILPAVDVGKSVSRVGGKTQLTAYRKVAGDLKLSYSQFEELESFSRFGAKLDEETQRSLDRGHRVRMVLQQDRYAVLDVLAQLVQLLAVNMGLLDDISVEKAKEVAARAAKLAAPHMAEARQRIAAGQVLTSQDHDMVAEYVRQARDELAGEALANSSPGHTDGAMLSGGNDGDAKLTGDAI